MESTLSTQFYELEAYIGFFLGHGRGDRYGDPTWDARQKTNIDTCVKSGISKVYFCAYPWSFLKPVAILTLQSGHNTLRLPDDYGGKEGPLTLALATGNAWWQLEFMGIGLIYAQQSQYPKATGRPQMVCEEPIRGTNQTQGQRFQLHFWPTADQDYPVQFQYYINPDFLSGAEPYLYGGTQHAETFREACLEVAEKLLDDAATVHALEFDKRLQISKDMDSRNKPNNLGTNRDRSDYKARFLGPYWRRSWSQISYKGTVY